MNKYIYIILGSLLLVLGGCDKNFEKTNTNPLGALDIDPDFQFTNSQFSTAINTYQYEAEIVQQINTPYAGVLGGGNQNIINESGINSKWNSFYNGPIKNLVDVLHKTEGNVERSNLYNMSRILKAFIFMILVDTYGDLPYFEAGHGYLDNNFRPKYDNQEDIYADLLNEVEDATDKLDPNKIIVDKDLFYKGNIDQWKRLGNSILLRMGMRYSKLDPAKAALIVAKAVDPARGGVMTSNADNVIIAFNTIYTNGTSNALIGSERGNFYAGAPFVDYLKTTNDPRLPVFIVKYENPTKPLGQVGAETTEAAVQIGMPYGYDSGSIDEAPGFPGSPATGGFSYSQLNRRTVLKPEAPMFLFSYAQSQLLLSEAALRSWTTGDAAGYYYSGIKANMDQLKAYDSVLGNISIASQDAYVHSPEIVLSSDKEAAIRQVNEQYWIASFLDGSEAWSNFRRSGYPVLTANKYPGRDPSVDLPSAGGFIRRLPYPNNEKSVNKAQVEEAIARQGGDDFSVRVFWDK